MKKNDTSEETKGRKGKKSLVKSIELAGAGVNNEARRACYGQTVCEGYGECKKTKSF